jgi:hypothetical protein
MLMALFLVKPRGDPVRVTSEEVEDLTAPLTR